VLKAVSAEAKGCLDLSGGRLFVREHTRYSIMTLDGKGLGMEF
jgi:hypothetical protein